MTPARESVAWHTSDEDGMQYPGNDDDDIQDSDIDGRVSVTTSSLLFYDDNPDADLLCASGFH